MGTEGALPGVLDKGTSSHQKWKLQAPGSQVLRQGSPWAGSQTQNVPSRRTGCIRACPRSQAKGTWTRKAGAELPFSRYSRITCPACPGPLWGAGPPQCLPSTRSEWNSDPELTGRLSATTEAPPAGQAQPGARQRPRGGTLAVRVAAPSRPRQGSAQAGKHGVLGL